MGVYIYLVGCKMWCVSALEQKNDYWCSSAESYFSQVTLVSGGNRLLGPNSPMADDGSVYILTACHQLFYDVGWGYSHSWQKCCICQVLYSRYYNDYNRIIMLFPLRIPKRKKIKACSQVVLQLIRGRKNDSMWQMPHVVPYNTYKCTKNF